MARTRTADYVVVGGGTAGAVVARRLADAGAHVVVLEAGPSGADDPLVRDLRRSREQWGTPLTRDRPIVRRSGGNPELLISSGIVLGGCSSHNGCVAFRPPPADFTEWERRGAVGWGPEHMGRAFARVRATVHVELADPPHPAASDFVAAGVAAGLPAADLTDVAVAHGIGLHALNKRGDLRESSAVAYLFSRVPDARLEVVCDQVARRLIVDDVGGVLGVQTDDELVVAAEEVVVCAGALGTPELLLRSGIGPAEQLAAAGISRRHELDGIGESFIDHPETTVMWSAVRPVADTSVNGIEASAFASLRGGERADVQIMFGTTRIDPIVTAVARRRAGGMPEHVLSMYPNVARARSKGSVRLERRGDQLELVLDPVYYTDEDGQDLVDMVAGIRLARRIAAESPLADWIGDELAPGVDVHADEGLAEYCRTTGATVYHQAGTCRMGSGDDRDAVVDPELRVRGVPGLRIADASIFPSMPTVNPCLTIMAIGERCAELLLERRPGPGQPSHPPPCDVRGPASKSCSDTAATAAISGSATVRSTSARCTGAITAIPASARPSGSSTGAASPCTP